MAFAVLHRLTNAALWRSLIWIENILHTSFSYTKLAGILDTPRSFLDFYETEWQYIQFWHHTLMPHTHADFLQIFDWLNNWL